MPLTIRPRPLRRLSDRGGPLPKLRSAVPLLLGPDRPSGPNSVSALPLPSGRRGPGQPLLSVRSQATCGLHQLDPDRMAISRADLVERIGPAGDRLYALATPKTRHGSRRQLSLREIYHQAAERLFGAAADQRIRYRSFERTLAENDLLDEFRPILEALPRSARWRLRAGALTPRQLFSARAEVVASWRTSPRPMTRAQAERALLSEGASPRKIGLLEGLPPADAERFRAGQLSAKEIALHLEDLSSRHAHLGIIGAGMAGIAAANLALEAQKSVLVLEAKDRPLGRVHTEEVDGAKVEIGGAWVHDGTSNPLTQLAKDLGYTLIPNDKFHFAAIGGVPSKEVAAALGARIEALAEAWAEPGPAERLPLSTRVAPKDELDRLAAEVLGPLEVARDLDQLSAAGQRHLVHEKDDFLVKDGMGPMLSSLAIGLPIRTDTPVDRIEWAGPQVRVWSKERAYTFDRLLITLSPAVLRSGAITFEPPLPPPVAEALDGFSMSSFEKILLRFDRDVFPLEGENVRGVGFDPEGHGFEVVLRLLGSKNAVVLVGGRHADRLVDAAEDEVLRYGLAQLARLFGPGVHEAFVGGQVTRWGRDPETLGSYAVPNLSAPPDLVERLEAPLDGKLGFAGEHLGAPGWRASIPGALASGREAARVLLAAPPSPAAEEAEKPT